MHRWIERYNNKLRQPAKKEEARRMKQFVNDAFAQDPRILQRRAEDKAQRCNPQLATYNTVVPCVHSSPGHPVAFVQGQCKSVAVLCLKGDMLHAVHMPVRSANSAHTAVLASGLILQSANMLC